MCALSQLQAHAMASSARLHPRPASSCHHAVMNTPTLTQPRAIERIVTGQATSDGAGVKLTRVLTQDLQRRLDPFLMLDAFGTDNPGDYIGGFPDHPHRGFETVTYMLEGRMRHRDSAGHEGLLGPGGVQWMTAGRGVIHSEMPEQQEGRMEGFQLWLNLPAQDKMREPWYRDIPSTEIPEAGLDCPVVELDRQIPDPVRQRLGHGIEFSGDFNRQLRHRLRLRDFGRRDVLVPHSTEAGGVAAADPLA